MAERIYNRTGNGSLDPLVEERFSTEEELQALIAEHPELLDGEQIRPGDPRRWLLITREKGIAESSESRARWSVDHLIVDQDAVPTLVEVKRGSNSEIRRTVVGQMLDYAANASQTWTADELRQTFEETASENRVDSNQTLRKLLDTDDEPDADGFWKDVVTNLAAKRMRLLFVADEIPDELERIIMFLNEKMPDIEVLAVEIKQFKGQQSQTLVPRVIGRIADSSQSSSSRLSRESFLADFADIPTRNAAERLLEAAQKFGGRLRWRQSAVSIRVRVRRELWNPPITLAWLYPPSSGDGWFKARSFHFGAAILHYDEPPEGKLRDAIEKWVYQFEQDEFTTDAQVDGISAWSVDYQAAMQHADVLAERLENVISELRSL
ncbi:MAG: hypothetical protein F4Y88_02245 [Chloroflexi bacterium]|nr:hypothetical protein [Chloroflexota bacterium]